jgi:hypothetical protein
MKNHPLYRDRIYHRIYHRDTVGNQEIGRIFGEENRFLFLFSYEKKSDIQPYKNPL